MSSFVLTRDQYIAQLTSRFEADELMFIPLTFTPATLTEMTPYLPGHPSGTVVTTEEFHTFVDHLNNDDEFFDSADATVNYTLENVLKARSF